MDWRSIAVLGVIGIVFLWLFSGGIFNWSGGEVVDYTPPGTAKYYYIQVSLTVCGWKANFGERGGVDVKEYDVKGVLLGYTPSPALPGGGEFQFLIKVSINGVQRLAKKFDFPGGTHTYIFYFDVTPGVYDVHLYVEYEWWCFWGALKGSNTLSQHFLVNLIRF